MLAAGRNGGDYVVVVTRNYDPDRDLAVIGAVAGVERAAAVVKANFAVDKPAKSCFESACITLKCALADG